MATIPNALFLVISSPYAERGPVYKAFVQDYGKDSDVLVWKAPSLVMNPTLDRSVVERALAEVRITLELEPHHPESLLNAALLETRQADEAKPAEAAKQVADLLRDRLAVLDAEDAGKAAVSADRFPEVQDRAIWVLVDFVGVCGQEVSLL